MKGATLTMKVTTLTLEVAALITVDPLECINSWLFILLNIIFFLQLSHHESCVWPLFLFCHPPSLLQPELKELGLCHLPLRLLLGAAARYQLWQLAFI